MLRSDSFSFGKTGLTLGVGDEIFLFQGLIKPLIDGFFFERGIDNYSLLSNDKIISDIDFDRHDFFSYFYLGLLGDINKCKSNNNVAFDVKYLITIDKVNCNKKCDKTHVCYDEILLSGTPILYFIYVDILDIISYVRRYRD